MGGKELPEVNFEVVPEFHKSSGYTIDTIMKTKARKNLHMHVPGG